MELGIEVEDVITGFKGTVMGYVQYLSGCHQALVAPRVDKKGELRESHWFDEQRLKRIGKKRITLDNADGPGFDILPHK